MLELMARGVRVGDVLSLRLRDVEVKVALPKSSAEFVVLNYLTEYFLQRFRALQ